MKESIAAVLKFVVAYTDYGSNQDFTGEDLVVPSKGEIADDSGLTLHVFCFLIKWECVKWGFRN